MIKRIYDLLISVVNLFFRVKVEYPYHGTDIWIHASSVGEINAISYLVNLFIEHKIPVFITTFTLSGLQRAKTLWGNNAQVSRFPMDKKSAIREFVKIARPSILIIAETELWPNLILETQGVTKYLVNARLSDRSFPRYMKLKRLFSRIIREFELILAQTEVDRERFISLGADPERVKVFGSLKYDVVKRPYSILNRKTLGYSESDIIMIFGSVRAHEESRIIDVIKRLRDEYENVQFILAPRHPVRRLKIVELLKQRNIPFVLRSSKKGSYRNSVLILDTLGELYDFYHISDIAFVGGTLAPYGGHSVIEPAYAGVPIIVGPHYENTREPVELLRKTGSAVVVNNDDELFEWIKRLIDDRDLRAEMGKKARKAIESKTGASEKTFKLIKAKLESGK